MMKVSIITVTKNAENTILHCLKSIHNQNYANIEHIMIDGKSTDNTVRILEEFPKVKECKIVSEEDLGIYDAINKGILISTGDLIGVLHADDFFSSASIVTQIVEGFKTYNTDILFAKVMYVERGNIDKVRRVYSSKYFHTWAFRFGFSPAHPTFYVKRELFRKYGMYRSDLQAAGDFDLMLRYLYRYKISFTYVDACWVTMRLGGVSTSGVKSVIRNNKEILLSLRQNGVYSNYFFIYAKYFIKIFELLYRK